MSTPARILEGLGLEQFLVWLSNEITTPIIQGWSAEAVRNLQLNVIECERYHLAGFSKELILDERSSSAEERNFQEKIHDMVVSALPNVVLTDPTTREKFAPAVWDACAALELRQNQSIDLARTQASIHLGMPFQNADYETCAAFGTKAASVFGRPLFYQMSIIGNFRRGKPDEAVNQGYAAKNGLRIAPWHAYLVELTLGNITANQLMPHAGDDDMRFQVRCYEGLRAFTNGNKEDAKRILGLAATMPNDLPMEYFFVKADFDRC